MSKYERFDGGVEATAEEGVNTKSTQQYGATIPAGDAEAPAEPTKKRWVPDDGDGGGGGEGRRKEGRICLSFQLFYGFINKEENCKGSFYALPKQSSFT